MRALAAAATLLALLQLSTAQVSVSKDGSCGSAAKLTCKDSGFGDCCSRNGWCGSTSEHCGAGCQEGFGRCGSGGGSAVCPPPPVCPVPSVLPAPGPTVEPTAVCVA